MKQIKRDYNIKNEFYETVGFQLIVGTRVFLLVRLNSISFTTPYY